MTNDSSPIRQRLTRLHKDLLACQGAISLARASGITVETTRFLAEVNSLADQAHALWPEGEEHRSPDFEDILHIKAEIHNLAAECRRVLAS
ncbi:hypothetical protein QFZ94_000116 [Paraburkholderia sp. JPY465]|uniref:hypothetical protein n=1 Tax=Paraburkholderia sp. JPY465 TaxID=3042285 RepID=UPI003D2385BC